MPLEIPSDGWPDPMTGTALSWLPHCLEGTWCQSTTLASTSTDRSRFHLAISTQAILARSLTARPPRKKT
jgi:hypothetical protein